MTAALWHFPRACRRQARRPISAVAAVVAVLGVLGQASPAAASDASRFQLPFACGEAWLGTTRSTHSPSSRAIDWNRDAHDEGHRVLASAPGVVSSVTNLGDASYGRYVVVDHGGGWSTLYAHLSAAFVVAGQRVDQGQLIALLGSSGGVTGAHLHYEQRLDHADQHAVFDGTRFSYGSWLRSRDCTDVPVAGNWDGEGRTEVGTFGHQVKGGVFRQRLPGGRREVTALGSATDLPVVGDWNGDGQSDLGTWTATTHKFVLFSASGNRRTVSFGRAGDLALAGDWNGDGRSDVGVFRPSRHRFYLRGRSGEVTRQSAGSAATWPITGDWDGDGRDNVGVFDPGSTTFRLVLADGVVRTVGFGRRTSLPVVGYFDGDARADLGVWNPRLGVFAERLGPKRVRTVRFGHPR